MFDRLFGAMVAVNEGAPVSTEAGRPTVGVPFTPRLAATELGAAVAGLPRYRATEIATVLRSIDATLTSGESP